ncbi:hypothetical protein H257_12118 [Aphanomyces astaci]|uniref:Uncharacterized protein n=1 Tax=Aphanomyces astaci TaxID=112090 RepID=W4G131_APHAT|nr:hypothetical protein H257_12118 [Aphanomyces astaci]ETV72744.1 hypothetical protein H257_12118 [Aphanomyces astaci]|eukprot:XP_009837530.1 hypothetical protein H257_12118 [Aphanomyces astaci]
MGTKRPSKTSQHHGVEAFDFVAAGHQGEADGDEDNLGSALLDIIKAVDVDRLRTVAGAGTSFECLLVIMNWMHKWQQEYECIMSSLTLYTETLSRNLDDNEAQEDTAGEIKEIEDEGVQVLAGFEKIALALLRSDSFVPIDLLDDMGWTLLMQAANCGAASFVHALVHDFDADIEKRQHNHSLGTPALARAIDAGHVDVLGDLCNAAMANAVFKYKCDDDEAADDEVHTPLTLACRGGHENIVSFLLGQGTVDVNLKLPDSEDSALHIAVCFDMEAIVKLLLQHPTTDINATNAQGYTAAFGCSNAALVDTLLSHGLDSTIEGFQGETLLDMALALGDEDVATIVCTRLEADAVAAVATNQSS